MAAGEVRPVRRTGNGQLTPIANVVCETDATGRLAWSVLRFSASALVGPNYRVGPLAGEHGFNDATFAAERVYMVVGGMHIWNRNKYILTADIIANLLHDAIATR